jgi:hypothetical protein
LEWNVPQINGKRKPMGNIFPLFLIAPLPVSGPERGFSPPAGVGQGLDGGVFSRLYALDFAAL